MRPLLTACLMSLVGLVAGRAGAYCLSPVTSYGSVYWAERPIQFRIHDTGSGQNDKAQELAAVRAAFAEWAAAECASLTFVEGALIPAGEAVTATPNETGIRVYWAHNATDWGGADASWFGQTAYSFNGTGTLRSAVTILNALGGVQWSVSGEASKLDLQSAMAVEVGTLIGVGLSNVSGAVMAMPIMMGDTSKRALTADDAQAAAYLYPDPAANPAACPPTSPDPGCPGTPPERPDGGVGPDASIGPPNDSGVDGALLDGPESQADAPVAPTDASSAPGNDGAAPGSCTSGRDCPSGVCTVEGYCTAPGTGDGGGCGCRATGLVPGTLGVVLLGVALALARRRR